MKATVEYVKRRFEEFNRQMFGGRLPAVPVKMSNARTFVGMCSYKKRNRFMRTELYDFAIRISMRFDLDADELDDVIIHEMIHYYIGVNALRDTSAHGEVFRNIMNSINAKYGRHVSVSHSLTPEQREKIADTRLRWRFIAVVSMADGRTGVKVLPRIASRIVNYYNKVSAVDRVSEVRLFASNSPFFGKFPCSSALNVVFVDAEELNENLTNAKTLHCDGKTLTKDW